MTQPTPIRVTVAPGGAATYHVGPHRFSAPRAAILAADAIDLHGQYVAPLRSGPSDSTARPGDLSGARGDVDGPDRSGAGSPLPDPGLPTPL